MCLYAFLCADHTHAGGILGELQQDFCLHAIMQLYESSLSDMPVLLSACLQAMPACSGHRVVD